MKQFTPSQALSEAALKGGKLVDTLTNRADLFLFSYSPKYRTLISWSDNAEFVLGVKDVAIARDGNLFMRHVHPDDRYLLLTDLEEALKGNSSYRATYRWIRPDTNETRWLHCRAGICKHEKEEVFEGLIMDLTEEFTGEVSCIAGPDSVQAILSAFPTLVFTVDRDLRLLRINRNKDNTLFNFGDEQFKFENFKIGKKLLDCFIDKDLAESFSRIMENLFDEKISHYHSRIALDEIVFNLEITPLFSRGLIEGLLFNISDISESIRLEREIANLQKADGLRLLAAGVAHNFNNALQGIIGQASILVTHPEKSDLVQKTGEAIIDTVNRTSELTSQLMAFNEQSSDELSSIDLNTIAMAAINNIEDLFTSGIKVSVTFGNPDKVKAQRKPLTTAIEAIIRNSKEAISKHKTDETILTIKTSQTNLGNYQISDLRSGTYTKMTITDSGSGMNEEEIKRCFEPFFTTKERDKDTGVGIRPSGLGLSNALSTIREYGGTVDISSTKGIGTTVSIYIPAEHSEAPLEQRKKLLDLKRRQPQIMIVDDDSIVLRTVETIIKDLGYECICADDAHKAYSLMKSHKRSLKLVLLDAVLPGVDGASILRGLKKINPFVPVIGFSGATPKQTEPLLREGAIKILRKPIGSLELKAAIEQALSVEPSVVNK